MAMTLHVTLTTRGATASIARASTPRRPALRAASPRTRGDRLGASIRRAASVADADPATLRPLPQTAAEMVAQCATCVRDAFSPAGGSHARQRIEILLPINQRRNEFTDPEASDYPESQDVVYKTAMETAAAVIRAIDPDGGELTARRVDDDNDPVGTLRNAVGTVRAVVIPNAQNLDVLREMANLQDADGGLTLLFNPQWNEAGQVVSDFGIGPWKRRAMDFLNTFELSYSLTESRVGAAATRDPARGGDYMGVGGVARVLKTHGGAWQVFAMGGDGSSECVRAETKAPDYEFLKSVFVTPEYSLRTRRSGAGPSLEARLESAATARSENGGAAASGGADGFDWSIASVAEISAAVRAKALTSEDCDALGKSGLRSALSALGLPTSGKLEAMRERLREALLAEDSDAWD